MARPALGTTAVRSARTHRDVAPAEEILEEARKRLDAAGFEHLPSLKIVLTGGASRCRGDGLASVSWGSSASGSPDPRPWVATGDNWTGFSSSVGMCLFATRPKMNAGISTCRLNITASKVSAAPCGGLTNW